MKLSIISLFLSFACLISSTAAADGVTVRIAPTFGSNFGETSYQLRLAGLLDAAGDSIVTLRSKLDFPTDISIAGGMVEMYQGDSRSPSWSLSARLASSLGDPRGEIIDRDWLGLLNEFETEFSNTSSEAEGSMLMLEFQASLRLFLTERFDFDLIGGLWYQKIDQDVIGAVGTQRPQGTDIFDFGDPVAVSVGGHVGIYEITYRVPYVGARGRFHLSPRSTVDLEAAGALVLFEDFDDHLLRGKTSVADGNGPGVLSSARYTIELGDRSGPAPFLSLEGRFIYLSADGKQVQTWYADDPATPDFDDTGQAVGGIPYDVESTQFSAQLRIGFRL